ncbi:hypothetical protein IFM89_028452 [Coptis chinensis]|uniref:NAC domain-containing protein n=1 Tax=Coptis chinensis TaxID=261450 RepID=A0A835MCC1_9MAGN|nr:hypothetical protein IFM89_028452 [Coptis chinensis]
MKRTPGKKVKDNPGKKTNWIMDEFWIPEYQIPKNKQSNCMKKVKDNPGKKTDWIMHEFWIPEYQIPENKQSNCMKLDDWVLYKIHYNNTRNKIKRQEGSDNEDDVVQGQAKGEAKGKGKKYIGRNGKRRRQEGNDNEDDVDKSQAEVEGRRNNLENLKVDSEFATSIEEAIELFDEYYIPRNVCPLIRNSILGAAPSESYCFVAHQ